jgi:hypothetical protein
MTLFTKTDRTLMAMLFERGTVREMDGILPDGRRWSVTKHGPSLFCDYVFYSGWISGELCDDFRGETAEETMDHMEAWYAAETMVNEMEAV